jgi:hypothetical protein
MTGLDTAAMTLFLAELSQAVAPGARAVVLMDKAGWHIADDLVVPDNLSLVFLPPYSPELNPIERLWLYLRDDRLTYRVFVDTAQIVNACCDAWNAFSPKPAASGPCAPIPGSKRSAINQGRYNTSNARGGANRRNGSVAICQKGLSSASVSSAPRHRCSITARSTLTMSPPSLGGVASTGVQHKPLGKGRC